MSGSQFVNKFDDKQITKCKIIELTQRLEEGIFNTYIKYEFNRNGQIMTRDTPIDHFKKI